MTSQHFSYQECVKYLFLGTRGCRKTYWTFCISNQTYDLSFTDYVATFKVKYIPCSNMALINLYFNFLSSTEQKELAVQLQSLSAQCEGSPVPLVLDSGLVVPPANLTDIPVCAAFTPKDLQPHLRPRRIESLKQDTGPFLFTPIHFGGGSLERKQNKANSKMGMEKKEIYLPF